MYMHARLYSLYGAVMWNKIFSLSERTKVLKLYLHPQELQPSVLSGLSFPVVLILHRLELCISPFRRGKRHFFLDTQTTLRGRDSFEVRHGLTANKGMISLTFKATQRAGS